MSNNQELEIGQLVTGPDTKDWEISGILDDLDDEMVEVEDHTGETTKMLSKEKLVNNEGDWEAHYHDDGYPVMVTGFKNSKAITTDEFDEYIEGLPIALDTYIRKSDEEIMDAGRSAKFDPISPMIGQGKLDSGVKFKVKSTAVSYYDNAIVVDFGIEQGQVHISLDQLVRYATLAAKQEGYLNEQ